jgi:cytochrome c-type biogenesis protein CcmE
MPKKKEEKEEIENETGINKKSTKTKNKKKSRSKRNRTILIIVAVVVIIVVLVVGLWGTNEGKDYPTVTKILDEKEKHIDAYIEFRGTVEKDSLDENNNTFNLTDDKNSIIIDYSKILLPSNFEEGKDVVIKGTLRQDAYLYVVTDEIIVGCASKY